MVYGVTILFSRLLFLVDSATSFFLLLGVCIKSYIGHGVHLWFVNIVILLCECVPGNLLEGLFDIYGFFCARLEVWDVVF